MTYVPAWQILHPSLLWGAARRDPLPYPLDQPRLTYVYVARNAIYYLFRALHLRPDEVVLAPAYHSGNEIRAIRAAGATVRYYSIGRDFLPDMGELDRLSREGARVLYVIHYLGWPQPLEAMTRLCQERGMRLVEDCALSFLSRWGDRPLGSIGSHSIFCLYKTLPIPDGGLLVENHDPVAGLTNLPQRQVNGTSTAGRALNLLLEGVRSRSELAGKGLAALKGLGGSMLSGAGVSRVPVGNIGFRIDHVDYAMTPLSRSILGRLDYVEIVRRRRANFAAMKDRLEGWTWLPNLRLTEGVCPLFFPIWVRGNKTEAAAALRREGIAAVEFWNYGEADATAEEFPDMDFMRRHVLELPIHQDVTLREIDHMVATLRRLGLSTPA
jgi:dTDP-4-amino-4,6-dideoxygalactose transaminase